MTFTEQVLPDPDQAALKDHQGQFDLDSPFGLKQATISPRRHRWFQVIDIGTPSGPYAVAPGLTAGSQQRIQFDNRPDYVLIACSGETATTGRLRVYLGEVGGPPIRIGQTGRLVAPAPHDGVITLVSGGTTTAYGTVIGIAGWDIALDLNPGL